MAAPQPELLIICSCIAGTITALDRQLAGRIVQRAQARLGWRPSEAAAAANMDQAEMTRQIAGDHHVWLDAAVAQGPDAMIEVGLALIEEAKAIPSQRELALAAVSSLRKPMAVADDVPCDQKRSA